MWAGRLFKDILIHEEMINLFTPLLIDPIFSSFYEHGP